MLSPAMSIKDNGSMIIQITKVDYFNMFLCLHRNCGKTSGTTTVPICSRPEKDTKSKFEFIYDGSAYHFYNRESNKYICKGQANSFKGQFLVAQLLDSDQCWIERLLHGLDGLETKEDEFDLPVLKEYEMYFGP